MSVLDGAPGRLLDVGPQEGPRRELVDRRGGAAVASLAELISSGESVLAVCADSARRAALAASAADPRRFGASVPRIACCRCGGSSLDRALTTAGPALADPGLVLVDWIAVARRPAAPGRFQHVVLIDPAPSESLEELALRTAESGPGPRYAHLAFGPAEVDLARRLLALDWELRHSIGEIWRGLAEIGEAEGERLRAVLSGPSRFPRAAEVAGRCVAVLCELGLCEWRADDLSSRLRVLSSERTDLGRSRAYRACLAKHQEAIRFLQSRAQT